MVNLEEWSPMYVGGLESHEKRKEARKKRKSEENPRLSHIMEWIIAFWLTHAITGAVSPTAILKHVSVLSKLADEINVKSALGYEKRLIKFIHLHKSSGKEIASFDEYIDKLVPR